MKIKILFFEIIIAGIISIILISYVTREQKDFEGFAMGDVTSTYIATADEAPVHLITLDTSKVNQLIKGWETRGKKEVILILGNSQTHSINQYKASEKTYNHLLFDEYKEDYDVITHSIPNANFQEFYLIFNFWLTRLPIKFVIIPAFMDDMREDGIREHYFPDITKMAFKLENQLDIDSSINQILSTFNTQNTQLEQSEDFVALKETFQNKSEKKLNLIMNKHFSSWERRPTIRGEIFTNLYLLRNTLLGISAQTKRKMIYRNYDRNMSALQGIIRIAISNNVKCLTYIPPIRTDVEPPYDLIEYENFKKEIRELLEKTTEDWVYFYTFEKVVPGELWGVKAATNLFGKKELDFMHFQYKGHVILYKFLNEAIKENLQ